MTKRTTPRPHILHLLSLLLLIALAAMLLAGESTAQGLPPDPTQHPPIRIDGDAGFLLPGSGVTGGLGTEDEPFVISGWTIRPEYRIGPVDMSDNQAAIWIENTQMHYRIEDLSIEGAFDAGIVLYGSGGHAHIADTQVFSDPSMDGFGGLLVGNAFDGGPTLRVERLLIQSDNKSAGMVIEGSSSIFMDGVVVTGTNGSGAHTGLLINDAQDVVLRNVNVNTSVVGMLIEDAGKVHLEGIGIINGGHRPLDVDAANLTAQDVAVISSSWTPRDIVSVKVSGDATLRGVQATGNIGLTSTGGLVSMENVLAVDANHGKWGGEGIRVQGVRDLVASGVEVYGFNRRGGLWIEGNEEGHWRLESVHIEVEDARLNLHGGSTVEADGIIVRGGNIDIKGSGEYELGDVLVEGGGIYAGGGVLELSIRDSVLRGGNGPDGYGAGINVDRASLLTVKNTRVQQNVGGISAPDVQAVALVDNKFEDNVDGFVSLAGLCSYRIENNRFTTEALYGGLHVSQGPAFTGGKPEGDVKSCTGSGGDRERSIAGNTFQGAGSSLLIGSAHGAEIRDNTFTDQVWYAMRLATLTDSVVADNTITAAGTTGIRAWSEKRAHEDPGAPVVTVWEDIARNTFIGNRITATTGGVNDISNRSSGHGMILAGIDNVVEGNWFLDNAGYGLVLLGDGNHLGENTFSGNGRGEMSRRLDNPNGENERTREQNTPGPGVAVIAFSLAAALVAGRRTPYVKSRTLVQPRKLACLARNRARSSST